MKISRLIKLLQDIDAACKKVPNSKRLEIKRFSFECEQDLKVSISDSKAVQKSPM